MGSTALYIFGSAARDRAGPGSDVDVDVDVFIDYDPASRFSLVEMVAIKQFLEGHLGVRVDLTTRDSLDPLLRERIVASAEQVF
jgi:hypothetical protein